MREAASLSVEGGRQEDRWTGQVHYEQGHQEQRVRARRVTGRQRELQQYHEGEVSQAMAG